MPNIQVFSLADVLGRAEAIKAQRLANQRMMDEQESERALSDILANSINIQQTPETLQGATPLPPELSGPPQPTTSGIQPQWQPGRTEANLSWDKAFENLAQADPRIRGKMALQLQQMRMQEEQSRLKALKEARIGLDYEDIKVTEDGRQWQLYNAASVGMGLSGEDVTPVHSGDAKYEIPVRLTLPPERQSSLD